MNRLALGLLTLALPLASACDREQRPPTVVNKSAEDAAELTTDIACEYVDRCGLITVTCVDCEDADGDCGGCTAEHERVDADTCQAELGPELEVGFGCEVLTDEEQALVDQCLSQLPAAECAAVEDVEAWANGGDGADPRDTLSACDLIEDIRSRCREDSSHIPPPSPTPG